MNREVVGMNSIPETELPEISVPNGLPREVTKRWMIVRMVIASIGVLCGVIIVGCFAIQYYWNTVAFGAISGVVSSVLLFVHVSWYRGYWHRQNDAYKKLTALMLTGCFSQLLGICAMCVYITLAIMLGQDLNMKPYEDNYWMATTWSFMTLKWGSGLFWYSRSYRRFIKNTEDNRSLVRT